MWKISQKRHLVTKSRKLNLHLIGCSEAEEREWEKAVFKALMTERFSELKIHVLSLKKCAES